MFFVGILFFELLGCAVYPHTALYTGDLDVEVVETTRASWIADEHKGRLGAYNDPYDPNALNASHPDLPYGTLIRVVNLDKGTAVVLRVSDKARPRPDKRLFVSRRAAELLGMVQDGVANVRIERIKGQTGIASWYGGFFHGRPTSSGEIYDQNALTAAHRFLPFGTIVRVTNLSTNQSVLVRVNDRGGFIKGRVIDLSRRAAEEIGIGSKGKALVQLEIVLPPSPQEEGI